MSSKAVDAVLAIQQQRAKEYRNLESLLRSQKDGAATVVGIQRATQVFQQLSESAMVLREELARDASTADISRIIDRIQGYESEKLRLTVEIEALKQSHIADQEDSPIGDDEQHGHTTCHCQQPLPREVRSALEEGYQKLETCIQNILECMEELQYIKHG